MQAQKHQKEEPSLKSLEQLLVKHFNPGLQQSQPATSVKTIEQTIKKLEKKLIELYSHEFPSSLSMQQSNQFKKDKAQREENVKTLFNILDILIQQILSKDDYISFDLLISLIKINVVTSSKVESIYELAKQIDDSAVIALPYDAGQNGPLIVSNVSDNVQQANHNESKSYFKGDQQLVSSYLQHHFYVVKRENISSLSTQIVQHICKSLISPFLSAAHECSLQCHIKFLQLLDSLSAPVYTYFLISCFKSELEKLSESLSGIRQSKINKSISSQKINKIIYSLSNISSRWEGSVYYSKAWEWDIKSKIILGLIGSNVSQTKLTAVKMLVEFCKKVEYSSFKPEDMQKYIRDNNLLGQIFSIDNHPEVVSKGKDIYEFLCKYDILQQFQIDVLLDLALKSNENVRKSIYSIIQSLGQANLTQYSHKILLCIQDLPRAIFYTDETLDLLQTLLVISPTSELQNNMSILYNIIKKHYEKLRKNMRQRLIRLYFQTFVMGVEENQVSAQGEQSIVVRNLGQNLGTNMSAFMLDSFVRVIKNQGGKQISQKCKGILKQSIEYLFKKYRIHAIHVQSLPYQMSQNVKLTRQNYKEILSSSPNFYSQDLHFELIKFLLQSYEGQFIPITYNELCTLIDQNIGFTKFIQYYDKQQQIQVIESILSHPNKDSEHLSNIVQIFSLIGSEVKDEVIKKVECWLLDSHSYQEKVKLGQFVCNNLYHQDKVEEVFRKISEAYHQKQINEMRLLGLLILLKNMLIRADKKGFGQYLPFCYSSNSFRVVIKVTNSTDVLKPFMYQLASQSYQTLSETISKILDHDNLKITGVNFKINDKYMSINDLQLRIGELTKKASGSNDNIDNSFQAQRQVYINVFDVFQSQWFDKSQLINQGVLNYDVIIALSQIFTKFTTAGRMHRSDCAKLFEIATQAEKITVNDSRIEHLFSHYSQNGQYLTLDQWLNFYQKSSQDNPGVVIDNLKKLGYSHLFKDQKDLLSQYNRNQFNCIREYIVKQAQFLYRLLYTKYNDKKMNRFCQQLLGLLPIERDFINEVQLQNKEQMQNKEQRKRIPINYKYLHDKLINVRLQQSNQLWYMLTVLQQNQKNNVFNISERNLKQINIKLIELLENILKLQKSHDDHTFLQIILSLATIVKKIVFTHLQQIFPKSLIDSKKSSQSCLQIDDFIQDPLSKQKWTAMEAQYRPIISLASIQYIVQAYLDKPVQRRSATFQTKQKILKIVQQLLFLFLLNPGLASEQKFQISHQLIFHKNRQIRSMFNNLYFLICEICPKVKNQYYSINFDKLSTVIQMKKESEGHRFDQFFKTLNKMLRLETNQEQYKIYDRVSEGIQNSIRQLAVQQYKPSILAIEFENSRETILLGKLMILDSIKIYKPDLQIAPPQQWLSRLLSQPHSNSTRSLLYRISESLCPLSFNLSILSQTMDNISINKNSQIRRHEHMGLYNLGCICYINSTIQQLFMIQPFKNAIIAADILNSDCESREKRTQQKNQMNMQENNNSSSGKDEYFFQFQYMMYQLMYGKREFFIPDRFCEAYTDFDNKPIDIKQQHDADQFLNSLLNRLQSSLKLSKKREIQQTVQDNFSGQMASIITCQSCFENKIKIQDFYVLTLEIKHNKNIVECFQKLTEPENISDYYCQKCEKKVELITKQLRIKKLPKFLFLHLQRLIFDLESLSKIKLEHLVDYPEYLDLSDFYSHPEQLYVQSEKEQAKEQILNENSMKYRLKGIIVHVGTSQSGHYYSIIREEAKWVKFDDSRVEDWKWDNYGKQKQGTYIIIYEQINNNQTQSVPLVIGNPVLHTKTTNDIRLLINESNFLQRSFSKHLSKTLSLIQIPPVLLSSSPNNLHIPFSTDYQLFITQKHKQIYTQAIEIIFQYLRLVVQAKATGFYEGQAEDIRNAGCYCVVLLHIWPGCVEKIAYQMLQQHRGYSIANRKLQEDVDSKIKTEDLRILLVNGDKNIRDAYKLVLVKMLSIFHAYNDKISSNYLLPIPKSVNLYYWYMQKILQYLISALFQAAKHPNKLQQYLQTLYLLTQLSQKITHYFHKNSLGPKLIHFMCNDDTQMRHKLQPYNYLTGSNTSSTNNKSKAEVTAIVSQILYQLISVHIQEIKQGKEMEELELLAYYRTNWYTKIYDAKVHYTTVGEALGLLAQRDKVLNEKLCQMVVQKLNRFSHSDQFIIAYIHLMSKLLFTQNIYNIQHILGIPKLLDPNPQPYNESVENSTPRTYKYQYPDLTPTDEHLQPILELIYTNRHQTNYFTMATTSVLLNLMLKNTTLWNYIINLPAPAPCNFYIDFIAVLIKAALKEDAENEGKHGKEKWKGWVNQIAGLLNQVESRLFDGQADKFDESQMAEKQMMMEQRGAEQNGMKIMNNQWNKWYRLNGIVKQIQRIDIKSQGQYNGTAKVLQDSYGIKIVSYQFNLDKSIKKSKLQFVSQNYNYSYQSSSCCIQVTIPYPVLPHTPTTTFNLIISQRSQQQNNQINFEQPQQLHEGQTDGDKARKIQGENQKVGYGNNKQQQVDQIFECPFCTSISYSWSNRCPVCGEQWGEMA